MEKVAVRPEILDLKKSVLSFPEGFLWGTSTSAYQVEGGIKNDWSEWENSPERTSRLRREGRTVNDFICDAACDSWHRYEEDLDLCLKLNNNAVRLGIEWARIEPKEGVWDVEAINHYRRVLTAAKERNLKVVLTLWHWTNPVWIAQEGGWANKKTIDYFLRYAEVVLKELGAMVDFWVTLNEPTAHIGHGYVRGDWPPNKKNPIKAFLALNNLTVGHKKVYEAIHKHFPGALVGNTNTLHWVEPARKWHPAEWIIAKILFYLKNNYFLNKIKNHLDYIGLDYYFHERIVWYPPFIRNKNLSVSDIGWEIFPAGLYHLLKYLGRYQKPIIIIENGLADAQDIKRPQFIVDHLRYVHKAISEGADVRGYFHWSLLDNFEWSMGWAPKFGLYKVDRDTFWRTPRHSAKVYAEICRNNAVLLNDNDSSQK